MRLAHLETYTELVERLAPELLKMERARWFDVLEADHDNIRAALDFAVASGEADLGLRLAAATWRFWQARGHLHEGKRRVEEVLALPGGEQRHRAKAIEALGGILWWRGDLERCHVEYEKALRLQEEIGDDREIANALYNYGLTLGFTSDDYPLARQQLERAKAIYERLGDENGLGDVAWGIGTSYTQQSGFMEGEEYYVEATEHYRRAGNLFGVGWSAFEVAGHRYRMGKYAEAWPYLRESIALFAEHRDVSGLVLTVSQAAGIALGVGDELTAYRMAGGYNRLRRESGTDLVSISLNIVQGLEPETLEHLTGDAMAAYLEGQGMSFEQLVAYVLAWVPEVEPT
jgi:tetratricopeptide (TPR) repeat protein